MSLRARRVCELANPVRKGFAVVLVRTELHKVVPYQVRKLTLPRSCEATPKERPWRSPLLEAGRSCPCSAAVCVVVYDVIDWLAAAHLGGN